MPDPISPNEYVTFVHQGGIPVMIVRHGGTNVRLISYGGKQVTFIRVGGIPVCIDDKQMLPEEVKEEIGY